MTRNSGMLVVCGAGLAFLAGCMGPKTLQEAVKARSSLQSYQMTARTSEGQSFTQFVKLVEGKPVKTKTKTPQGWILMDQTEKAMYMGGTGRPNVMKMSLAGPQAQQNKTPDAEDYDGQAPVIGTEDVDGVSCVKVQVTGKDGKSGTLWVGLQYGLMRKFEQDGKATTFAYDQVNAVPDTEFELPAGAKVVDMSGLQQGFQRLMGR